MQRIIVIGCPGSGKSTFSKKLQALTGIPLFHLDMMFWNSDKTFVDRSVLIERQEEAMLNDSWIIDGNYISTMGIRLEKCDTVIFLDYPAELCLESVRNRKGKLRSDLPWTEPEEDDEEFMEYIKTFGQNIKPRITELLDLYSHRNIFIFTDRGQADSFLEKMRAHS